MDYELQKLTVLFAVLATVGGRDRVDKMEKMLTSFTWTLLRLMIRWTKEFSYKVRA